MKNVFLFIILIFANQKINCQINKSDSLLISKCIKNFRIKDNTECQILSRTFSSIDYIDNFDFITSSIKTKFKVKLSKEVINEISKNIKNSKINKTPNFPSCILTEEYSENYNRLRIDMSFNLPDGEEITTQQIEFRKINENRRLSNLKETISSDLLNIIHISEPFYDKKKSYCVFLISYLRPNEKDLYIIIYSKKTGNWDIIEKQLIKNNEL